LIRYPIAASVVFEARNPQRYAARSLGSRVWARASFFQRQTFGEIF